MTQPNRTDVLDTLVQKGREQMRRRRMASDEEPMDYTAVLTFLREKLNENDLVKVGQMLGVEVERRAEDRRSFAGASDAAPVTYDASSFPHAGRLKTSFR